MHTLVIFNPGSHSGRSRRALPAVEAWVKALGPGAELRTTQALSDARAFSQEASEQGARLVVAVGGDGTINQTLCGLYNQAGARRSSTKLGVVYTGTSPDFCKSHGLVYHQVKRSLEALQTGRESTFYPGVISLADSPGGQPQTRYFGCAVNLGIGAAVARAANAGLRTFGGDRGGTLLALVKAFFRYRPSTFTVEQDGVTHLHDGAVALSIGRTSHIASGIRVVLDRPLDPNELYLMAVTNVGLTDIPRCLTKLYGGRVLTEDRNFQLLRVKSLVVPGGEFNNEVEFDGDPQGWLPCRIGVAAQPVVLVGVTE